MATTARSHLFENGPLAGYAVKGVGNDRLSTGISGLIGVLVTFGIGEGIITALTVGVVLGVRPDLVYGAQDLQAPLVLGTKNEPAGEVR